MKKAIFAMLTSLTLIAPAAFAADALVTKKSSKSVEAVVTSLKDAVTKAGAELFAQIDHAAGARAVGLTMPPTVLVVFGNPNIGSPIIRQDRRVGLHLPLHVLIWENETGTNLSYEDPKVIASRYAIKADDENLKKLSMALDKLTNAAL